MSATEEWLRYIENRVMHDRYGVNGYEDSENPEEKDDKNSIENTKEIDNV